MNRCIVCGRKIRQQYENMCKTCAEYEDKLIQKDKVIADYQELLKDISENFDGVNDYCENWCNWLIYKKEHDRPICVSKEMFEKLKKSGCFYEPKIDLEEENRILKRALELAVKTITEEGCENCEFRFKCEDKTSLEGCKNTFIKQAKGEEK